MLYSVAIYKYYKPKRVIDVQEPGGEEEGRQKRDNAMDARWICVKQHAGRKYGANSELGRVDVGRGGIGMPAKQFLLETRGFV